MNNKLYIVVFFISTFLFTSCINFYKRGNVEFSNLKYHKASEHYKKEIAKKDNHDAKIKLANCYRLTNDYVRADSMYAIIVKYPEISMNEFLHYGKILMNQAKYDDAKIWFKRYLSTNPNDVVAKMLLSSCNSVNQFMKDTSLYTLESISFPEFESLFSQVPYGKGIVFTADKKTSKKSQQEPWTGKTYYDLYFSEKDKSGKWLSPQLLKGAINGKYHEGPATFNKMGNIVYFTRSNYYNSELKKNAKNENNLKIFKAKLINDEWTQLEELPFNSDDYSVGHPCLTEDEKTLYFISDMPGGFGGTDIYKVVFNEGFWGSPQNLGTAINTTGNEMFPFISSDGTFYFSSDAHNNLGGLDVFATSYDAKNGKWLQVENLNYPLNSSKDDFAFYLQSDNKTGFISSNRNFNDHLYEFHKNDPTFTVSGKATYKGTLKPFEAVSIILIDETDKNIQNKLTVLTDKNGYYKFKLNVNSDYVIASSKENYFSQSFILTTKGEKYSKNFVVNFELDEIIIDKPIVLENIYYDFDKWFIRPDAAVELDKLVKLLKDNPTISIEMGSHTDSRAGDRYNLILSEKRAKAAVDFLVFRGIDASRLKYKGYGESRLVNHCKNNVFCSEEDHQKNRRTEFKVIKITK